MTAWNRESQTVIDSRDIGLQALGSRSLVQLSLIENFFKPMGSFWTTFLRSHRFAMCLVISLSIQPSLLSRDVSLSRNVPSGEERERQSFITQLKYSSPLRRKNYWSVSPVNNEISRKTSLQPEIYIFWCPWSRLQTRAGSPFTSTRKTRNEYT